MTHDKYTYVYCLTTAGRLVALTQTPTIYAVNGRTGVEITSDNYTFEAVTGITGCYRLYMSEYASSVDFLASIVPHADDQAAVADVVVISPKVDDNVDDILEDTAAMPTVAQIWAGITAAAKTAIANAVYAVIGSRVTVVSPQSEDDDLTIYSGTDYLDADDRAFSFSSANWPDLTGATIAFVTAGVGSVACALDTVGAGVTQSFHLDLTAANSVLIPNSQTYYCQATLANTHIVRLVTGDIDLRS